MIARAAALNVVSSVTTLIRGVVKRKGTNKENKKETKRVAKADVLASTKI